VLLSFVVVSSLILRAKAFSAGRLCAFVPGSRLGFVPTELDKTDPVRVALGNVLALIAQHGDNCHRCEKASIAIRQPTQVIKSGGSN
jgi:hypothetical protein